MNCQIVVCPGVNDSAELELSMVELEKLYPACNSVSIVPVGLTRHRENLPELVPFDESNAAETVAQVEAFAEKCLQTHGSSIFFCADELYIKAKISLPADEYYESYPQLENGVGMLRLLITELRDAMVDAPILASDASPFTIATGISAAPFITELLRETEKRYAINGSVVGIANDFFGHSVDVAGLVTGGDIIKALRARELGKRLLIPRNMLRVGEEREGGVFLDDVTVAEIEKTLGVTVRIVEQDGADLLAAFLGK